MIKSDFQHGTIHVRAWLICSFKWLGLGQWGLCLMKNRTREVRNGKIEP